MLRSIVLGASALALLTGAAQAADLIIPTTPVAIYEPAGFSWEGLYAGVRAGGEWYDDGVGSSTYGVIGGVVGVNFAVADPFLVGVEVTGDYLWNDVTSGGEFFANLKAGAVVSDAVFVYAIGGVGVQTGFGIGNEGLYQLGGGVEIAVTDSVTVRGEVVGVGDFGGGDDFFEGAKATVGVFYHF